MRRLALSGLLGVLAIAGCGGGRAAPPRAATTRRAQGKRATGSS